MDPAGALLGHRLQARLILLMMSTCVPKCCVIYAPTLNYSAVYTTLALSDFLIVSSPEAVQWHLNGVLMFISLINTKGASFQHVY